MRKIILLVFMLSSILLYAEVQEERNTRILISNTPINCDSNLVEKEGDCEFILSYDFESMDVFLIKLYKRGTADADINDLSRDPARYERENLLVDYKDKIKLKNKEKIISIGGSFVRQEDKENLKIRLRVQIGKVKLLKSSEIDPGPEEEIDEEVPEFFEMVTKKRRKEIEIKI